MFRFGKQTKLRFLNVKSYFFLYNTRKIDFYPFAGELQLRYSRHEVIMMYEIIGTEKEEGTRLIKVKDLAADLLMIYYQDEVKHIPDPDLNFFLTMNMWSIMQGAFDKPAL